MTLREVLDDAGMNVEKLLDAPVGARVNTDRGMLHVAASLTAGGPGDRIGDLEVNIMWRRA